MDDFLDQIEEAAKRRNMSISAVAEAATGNPSAFKNLREVHKTRIRRSAIETNQRFADVLGLEFYLGPPRLEAFQEALARFDHVAAPDTN